LNASEINGIWDSSQRFNGESSSLSLHFCNSSIRFIAGSNESKCDHRSKIEKKRERNSRIPNRLGGRRGNYQFISESEPRINKAESQIPSS